MTPALHVTEYFFSAGSPFPQALAAKVGPELEQLRTDLGRGPQARDVLEWALTHRESAISQCFDWDVQRAAEAHWLRTAGDLTRAIQVRLVVEQPADAGSPKAVVLQTRLMHHVMPLEAGLVEGKVYLPATETLGNVHYRGQILDSYLAELDRWTRKVRQFKELSLFVRAIEEANRQFGRTPSE